MRPDSVVRILIILLLALGCEERDLARARQKATRYSSALIILPGAQGTVFHRNEWGESVTYLVEEEYPASRTIARVCQVLEKKGWEPMKMDWLHPDIRSSHIRGWTHYIDASRPPQQYAVHQWSAQWRAKNGDIVDYDLLYRVPIPPGYDQKSALAETKGLKQLSINAHLDPTEVFKKRIQAIQSDSATASATLSRGSTDNNKQILER